MREHFPVREKSANFSKTGIFYHIYVYFVDFFFNTEEQDSSDKVEEDEKTVVIESDKEKGNGKSKTSSDGSKIMK